MHDVSRSIYCSSLGPCEARSSSKARWSSDNSRSISKSTTEVYNMDAVRENVKQINQGI